MAPAPSVPSTRHPPVDHPTGGEISDRLWLSLLDRFRGAHYENPGHIPAHITLGTIPATKRIKKALGKWRTKYIDDKTTITIIGCTSAPEEGSKKEFKKFFDK